MLHSSDSSVPDRHPPDSRSYPDPGYRPVPRYTWPVLYALHCLLLLFRSLLMHENTPLPSAGQYSVFPSASGTGGSPFCEYGYFQSSPSGTGSVAFPAAV